MFQFVSLFILLLQSNSVITNSTGPRKSALYNREGLCSKGIIWDQKSGVIFVCYNRVWLYNFYLYSDILNDKTWYKIKKIQRALLSSL